MIDVVSVKFEPPTTPPTAPHHSYLVESVTYFLLKSVELQCYDKLQEAVTKLFLFLSVDFTYSFAIFSGLYALRPFCFKAPILQTSGQVIDFGCAPCLLKEINTPNCMSMIYLIPLPGIFTWFSVFRSDRSFRLGLFCAVYCYYVA